MSTKSAKSSRKRAGAKNGKTMSQKRPGKGKEGAGHNGRRRRLRPGELDGLVLVFLREHESHLPLSPSAVAKGIDRSAGAVANCLERLAKSKQARLARKAPRAYDLKRVNAR